MSLEEAKSVLGFPPTSTPSPGDIKSAYRAKALQMHPDRGGKEEDFKAVGLAYDILTGKARPTYDRRPSGPSTSPSTTTKDPGYTTQWTPPPKKEVTFEQAEAKAGIPGGVEWKFVTPYQRGKGWMGDESSLSDRYFVAYGRTERQHVFVAAHHHQRHDHFIGGSYNEDVWTLRSVEHTISKDEGTNPSWLYRNVIKALKEMKFPGRFNSKVLDAKGWRLGTRLPTGAPTSIKHWLVNSGEVTGDSPAVAGRKQVVEINQERTFNEKPGYYPEPKARHNFWDGAYHGDYYKVALILNGRQYYLSERDTQKYLGARLGGKVLPRAIFGDYSYGAKKNLTRLRRGKVILTWMTEKFEDLPKDAVAVLEAAAAQMKG